jgi:hypothetical protein
MSDPAQTHAHERPPQSHAPEAPTLPALRSGAAELRPGALEAPAGYELQGLIGEGGMGVVYRARELALGRDVALKFLRVGFTPQSAVGVRFIEEARITGQLQHPGIPPVHQVGTLPDGRPFLAMKLIKGNTLDELLNQRTDPGAERGRWLAVFEQVAQAVGYAHAHNVIHRDLKPANIMVGSFGEVQVMDWGVAKVLGADRQPEPQADDATLGTEIRSLRDGATQAGSLLGTPAFMPPEQAIGAVDQITARSDVFGLGAILCVILTGRPPFVAESAEATRQQAARAKLADAFTQLDRCGAEPELVSLAKRCLAPDPPDRPRDAGEVADALLTLRAAAEERARRAEMDRARAEVRATEEGKRRRWKRALGVSVLALVAVAGFAAWGFESARAERRAEHLLREAERANRENELRSRQLATERDVIAALNEAQVLREEGWKQAEDPARWALTLSAARSSFKRAEALLGSGEPTDELRARVAAVGTGLAQDESDRALLAELDRINEENELRFLIPIMLTDRHAERYERAFRAYGADLGAMPRADAAVWLKGHRFRERLTIAVRNWEHARPFNDLAGGVINYQTARACAALAGEATVEALLQRQSLRDRLHAVLDDVTDDPFAREWWAAALNGDGAAFKKLRARPEFDRLSSRELSVLIDALFSTNLGDDKEGIGNELLTAAYDRFPGEYWVNFRLGARGALQGSEGPEDHARVLRHLTAAVAARPHSAMPRAALGMALLAQRRSDPAGFRMLRGAAALDPTSPWPHLLLGQVALEAANWPDAVTEYREAVRVDPEIGYFMVFMFFQFGAGPEATRTLAGVSRSELARFYDDLIALHPERAGGYIIRAFVRYRNGEYRAALADYRKVTPTIAPGDPLRAFAQVNLASLQLIARWEDQLPAVLADKLRPEQGFELLELAEYCAGFEQKYALAARFAADAFAKDPALFERLDKVPFVANWTIRAAAGKGVGAAHLSEAERSGLRTKALAWLRQMQSKLDKTTILPVSDYLFATPDLAPVREPDALAKLPSDERAEWTRFWAELPRRPAKLEPAPAPRAVDR